MGWDSCIFQLLSFNIINIFKYIYLSMCFGVGECVCLSVSVSVCSCECVYERVCVRYIKFKVSRQIFEI